MSNQVPYEILVGVGTIYIAPAGTAKPALTATPSGSWRSLGDTDDGVKVTKQQTIEKFGVDQSTGMRKAVRTEEAVMVESNLAANTLENLADVLNGTVTDTPPGSGTIGTRSLKMYSGADVDQFAIVYRGKSAYGDFPAQYYVPVAIFEDDVEMEYKKGDKTLIPVKVFSLEDPNAATEADRFGVYEMQDAAAL